MWSRAAGNGRKLPGRSGTRGLSTWSKIGIRPSSSCSGRSTSRSRKSISCCPPTCGKRSNLRKKSRWLQRRSTMCWKLKDCRWWKARQKGNKTSTSSTNTLPTDSKTSIKAQSRQSITKASLPTSSTRLTHSPSCSTTPSNSSRPTRTCFSTAVDILSI